MTEASSGNKAAISRNFRKTAAKQAQTVNFQGKLQKNIRNESIKKF